MATMIATHGRNLKGSSNVVLYLEAVIFTPYCTAVKSDCPASSLFVKADFCTSQWYVLFFVLSQVNIWPMLLYAAFSKESIASYRGQARSFSL